MPVKYSSSKNSNFIVDFKTAALTGQAPDGGLFIPEFFPKITLSSHHYDLPDLAQVVLAPFTQENLSPTQLKTICREAFNFPVILKKPEGRAPEILELFHGPTSAFKDFGARFLARTFVALGASGTILVATSGDTGGAVASAFHRLPNLNVVILFPKSGVSPLQEKQLTCWGDNVTSLRVDGDFDDCQRLVKEMFGQPQLVQKFKLTSANSINIARLLPQMVYYFWAAHEHWLKHKKNINLYIPTGNMGNAMAAIWARQCGAQVNTITMCTNANPTLADYFLSGQYTPKKSIRTLANAMDVGVPSNLERHLKAKHDRHNLTVIKVDDEQISRTIGNVYGDTGETLCPHTATAWRAWQLSPMPDAIVVATAHPAKFLEVVLPITAHSLPMPPPLQALMQLNSSVTDIPPTLDAVKARLVLND